MKNLVALVMLDKGGYRVRSLVTKEVLCETQALEQAQQVAETEASRLGSISYTWISETIEKWILEADTEP
jgi:hypothetical protein